MSREIIQASHHINGVAPVYFYGYSSFSNMAAMAASFLLSAAVYTFRVVRISLCPSRCDMALIFPPLPMTSVGGGAHEYGTHPLN